MWVVADPRAKGYQVIWRRTHMGCGNPLTLPG